ncbi:autophagy-related protein 7 [Rhodotorula toruloides]|uniref:Ubiquitin-like modifier-activating enzyme ATG7 n=1 Tax=Rhodotorula toruloides TaxID=5286 RepID=A0A511KA03_RHOTO|nr:autophagy-related protein 7 [Rhodotorula toruloides]
MASPTQQTAPLQFLPLSTSISPSFWHRLTDFKLHHLKLSDDPVAICGWYGRGKQVKDRVTGESAAISAGLELDNASFDAGTDVGASDPNAASHRVRLRGVLRNFNTIEEFRNCDKAKLLDELGEQIWQEATSASSSSVTLESLNPFLLITFADLKKYRYYYWCGFPALAQKPGWEIVEDWREVLLQERRLVFSDPSAHQSAPGWPLRNILLFLSTSPTLAEPVTSIVIIVVRDGQATSARIRRQEGAKIAGEAKRPVTVGWEKNEKGKLGPRMADLGPLMDPTRLADQAVDLNLQLMRWRIMPSLDLEKVKNTKCLLLGAGTLGCYVARTLMAWGVRKITLVDSSTVSFSNPVRQPLFEFEDSLNGGKPKAQSAASALKRIYPGVDAIGVSLSIPMPGHPVPPTAQDAVRHDLATLERLFDAHDVVYLLMDSRESRWLPTVIGAAKGKLVMNVALGFDTFLVMRHGLPTAESAISTPAKIVPGVPYRGQLGCYYCNDVVAPMDSLSDRTLDQMCTVTRPGIASIASSTAVELMVSILQHPQGVFAPSDIPASKDAPAVPSSSSPSPASPLGVVPHQIRGFLANFENLKITGHAFERCTGCSKAILDAYRTDAFGLVRQSCEDAKYLERLTGLDKLEEETEALLAEGLDWDEEDEEA